MAVPDGPIIPQYMSYALSQVVDVYFSRGVELPERRYWLTGTEAFDCPQVVIAVKGASLGTAGAPAQLTRCSGPKTLSFTVDIIRCAPSVDNRGRLPDGSAVEAAALMVATDMELLLYDLPGRLDVYQSGIVASVTAVGPDGGMHGAAGAYTVTL
jgi:hypothetical protein